MTLTFMIITVQAVRLNEDVKIFLDFNILRH